MKITNVTATVLRLPEISSAADGTQDDLIIKIETDEGITGYGEVDTASYVGKAIKEINTFLVDNPMDFFAR